MSQEEKERLKNLLYQAHLIMDYEKKFILGDLVKGQRTLNGEIIKGKFNGFHLYNNLNPTSVVGVIYVEGDRCYDVLAGSIELLESEDEKIRKEIIECVKNYGPSTANPQLFKNMLDWLEKQGEQNPTDKVEPKFKVGDFILNGDITNKGKHEIFKILKVCSSWYDVENIYDGRQTMITFAQEYTCKPWTIQNAKDGDVLAFYYEYKGNKMIQIGIIEKYVGKHGGCSNTFNIYVGVNWENNLQICGYMGCSDIRPATKEQREFLSQKMKEARYEWNAEKKELRSLLENN